MSVPAKYLKVGDVLKSFPRTYASNSKHSLNKKLLQAQFPGFEVSPNADIHLMDGRIVKGAALKDNDVIREITININVTGTISKIEPLAGSNLLRITTNKGAVELSDQLAVEI